MATIRFATAIFGWIKTEIYTRAFWEAIFLYANGRWTSSPLSQEKDSIVPPLPVEKDGPVGGPDESPVHPWSTSKTFYRGFHFYRQETGGEKQLDFGLNGQATYPFSAGDIPAILDPEGRIWVGDRNRGAHPDNMMWYVERKGKDGQDR